MSDRCRCQVQSKLVMRDTSDMMEDNTSEDTMMDCGDDGGGLDDLVELAANIADSSPSIRDAAERLLTLLGVDEHDDDFSSEDEGVEVDLDESDDEDEPRNTRLLQQLAASLAQELKFAQRQNVISSSRTPQSRSTFEPRDFQKEIQCMDLGQDSTLLNQQDRQNEKYSGFSSESSKGKSLESQGSYSCPPYEFKTFGTQCFESSNLETSRTTCLYSRVDVDALEKLKDEKLSNQETNSSTWNVGWDACASEALRYLVEDEGLPPHHPTIVAMKNHLDLQREQAFVRYMV